MRFITVDFEKYKDKDDPPCGLNKFDGIFSVMVTGSLINYLFIIDILPIAYLLLPIYYCLLTIAYCLLPIAY